MKGYSHIRLGVGLLGGLIAVLLAMLPSRGTLLSSKFRNASPPPVTWTELPVSGPEKKARSEESASVDRREPVVLPTPKATYTLHLGPFVIAREADDAEARLNELGMSTMRYRQPSSSALYAVKVGEFRTLARAIETTKHLALRHPALRLGKLETTAGGALTIVADSLYPLREAVALAVELRKEGFAAQVKTAEGAAPVFVVRPKQTYDLQTAQEMSRQFHAQRLPNAVVLVKPSPSR